MNNCDEVRTLHFKVKSCAWKRGTLLFSHSIPPLGTAPFDQDIVEPGALDMPERVRFQFPQEMYLAVSDLYIFVGSKED